MNPTHKILTSSIAAALLLISEHVLAAADAAKKEGRVTWIIRDVKLLSSKSAARAAVVNDKVREGAGVRTGDDSRSELTFLDLTITRLGANTVFSFTGAGRNIELGSGSVLLSVPKDSGGAHMTTDAVTVGVTGTTLTLETARSGRNKLILLEGGARLSLNKHPSESAYVRAGQMLDVPPGATKLPPPVDIDLDQFMKTSPLITGFPPLPRQGLISAAAPTGGSRVYPGLPISVGVAPFGPSFGPRGPGRRPGRGQGGQHFGPPGSASGSPTPGRTVGGAAPNPKRPNVDQPNATRSVQSKSKPSPTPSRSRKPSQGQPN
jgi:FecR-like protein